MSKKSILKEDAYVIDEETLSRFDSTFLFTYSVLIFLGGILGDRWNIRKLLASVYLLLSLSYSILGAGGYFEIKETAYFYTVFIIIGSFSAFLWPPIIHILGNWYSKKNRGLILGLWATSANIGNILGI